MQAMPRLSLTPGAATCSAICPLHHPLQLYDGRVRRSRHPGRYPRILFLVTGRGPQRQAYEERMRGLDLRYVAFRWAAAQ